MRVAPFVALFAACADTTTTPTEPETGFTLTSSAFAEGDTIPLQYECGPPFTETGPGENLTPPLAWTPGPAGTQSYAVILHDRDFRPAGFEDGLIHWAIYDIPGDVTALPEGIPDGAEVADPAGAKQAEMQGTGFFGYFGPCSPNSVNTYELTVFALPAASLALDGDDSEIHVDEVVEASALAQASLAGES